MSARPKIYFYQICQYSDWTMYVKLLATCHNKRSKSNAIHFAINGTFICRKCKITIYVLLLHLLFCICNVRERERFHHLLCVSTNETNFFSMHSLHFISNLNNGNETIMLDRQNATAGTARSKLLLFIRNKIIKPLKFGCLESLKV